MAEAAPPRSILTRAREAAQKFPALTGSLLVACGYALMEQAWRTTAEATLIYSLGAYVLLAVNRESGRGVWLSSAWNLAFVVDLGVKAFLLTVYRSPADSTLFIEGVSNTNSNESTEFLMNYWQLLGSYTVQLLGLLGLLLLATRPVRGIRPSGRKPVYAAAVIFALLHLDPAIRRANPLVFWPVQAATIEEFRANLDTLHEKREIARAALPQWNPQYRGPGKHTVGFVIGESTNRWDWQLYGYARATTPELLKRKGDLLVFRDVISAASSTVSALRYMLTPRSLQQASGDEELPSVLMLARAAGYKVFWISNQHDRYITTRFAEEADEVHLLNKGGVATGVGDSRSLDERLLPAWRAALADPAPRKLIIAHLLGAHAHYDLRSPEKFQQFESSHDEVDEAMVAHGRPDWVRIKRDQYDDAMRYQDWMISQLLDEFRSAVGKQSAAWLYTSDHGEEVGHTRNFTGHSPDEAGQVVPLLAWTSAGVTASGKRALESRPFQTDTLDWTLLDLLHVRTRNDQPQTLVMAPDFHAPQRRLSDGSIYRPNPLLVPMEDARVATR